MFLFKQVYGIFALVSLAGLVALADYFPHSLEPRFGSTKLTDDLENSLTMFRDGSIGGPFIYRVLIPWLGISFIDLFETSAVIVFSIGNFIFSFTALLSMYFFAKNVKSTLVTLGSIFGLTLYMLFTQAQFQGITFVETQDALNLAVFLLGLSLLKNRSWWWLAILITLSIFNRESALFLLIPMAYFSLKEKNWMPTIFATLGGISTYLILRLWIGNSGNDDWIWFDKISKNIPGLVAADWNIALKSNILVALYFSPLIALFLAGSRKIATFYKPVLLMSVLFIVVHYIVGTVMELRLFLPIIGILLPLAIENFEVKKHSENQK